jgi:hypothetical protein
VALRANAREAADRHRLGALEGAATAVVVLRNRALPIALNSAMWEKHRIGQSLNIVIDDPETEVPAIKDRCHSIGRIWGANRVQESGCAHCAGGCAQVGGRRRQTLVAYTQPPL